VIESLTLLFTVLALGVAWLLFRLERAAARRRDIVAARNVLLAVQRGVVEGVPAQGLAGWGDLYFGTIYDASVTMKRALETRVMVEQRSWDQVFLVPTETLELPATTRVGDLISEETMFAANLALWRIGVFNQLVEQQTAFNAQHAAEIVDPATSTQRLRTLAEAAGQISLSLHADGIGAAAAPGGWYERLTSAVAADVERLTELLSERWWRYRDERRLVVGDAVVAAVCIGFSAVAIVHASESAWVRVSASGQSDWRTPARLT
jgi:hypothetical protein